MRVPSRDSDDPVDPAHRAASGAPPVSDAATPVDALTLGGETYRGPFRADITAAPEAPVGARYRGRVLSADGRVVEEVVPDAASAALDEEGEDVAARAGARVAWLNRQLAEAQAVRRLSDTLAGGDGRRPTAPSPTRAPAPPPAGAAEPADGASSSIGTQLRVLMGLGFLVLGAQLMLGTNPFLSEFLLGVGGSPVAEAAPSAGTPGLAAPPAELLPDPGVETIVRSRLEALHAWHVRPRDRARPAGEPEAVPDVLTAPIAGWPGHPGDLVPEVSYHATGTGGYTVQVVVRSPVERLPSRPYVGQQRVITCMDASAVPGDAAVVACSTEVREGRIAPGRDGTIVLWDGGRAVRPPHPDQPRGR